MKKMLYAGGLLFVLGLFMLVITVTVYDVNWTKVLKVVDRSPFVTIGMNLDENYVNSNDNYQYDEIISMDLDLAIADVTVTTGDKFTVDVKEGCGMEVTVAVNNGNLVITDKQRTVCLNDMGSKITVVVPEGIVLTVADIEISMGSLTVKNIQVDELEVVANMGDVDLVNCVARIADIELSMGDLTFSGNIEKEADISNAMGKVTLELNGAESDYALDISNSLGTVRVGSNKYDSFNNTFKVNQGASKEIKIDNNMGDITIKFR